MAHQIRHAAGVFGHFEKLCQISIRLATAIAQQQAENAVTPFINGKNSHFIALSRHFSTNEIISR